MRKAASVQLKRGGLLKEHFGALFDAYTQHVKLGNVDWNTVFAGSHMGMPEWLEYNVKRALGIEAETEFYQNGMEDVWVKVQKSAGEFEKESDEQVKFMCETGMAAKFVANHKVLFCTTRSHVSEGTTGGHSGNKKCH